MKDWLKKILGTAFLTLLIWAWAYLSLESEIVRFGSLSISADSSQEVLAGFVGRESKVTLKLTFKGAPAKISDLARRYRAGEGDIEKERLDFYYNPKDFGHVNEGTYKINLVELIQQSQKIRDLVLTLESCEPQEIEIQIEKLVEKNLAVQCVDESGAVIKHDTIEPAQAAIFVRQGYAGPANVMMTAAQIERARKVPVMERPYVEFEVGKRRYAAEPVKISLAHTEPLKDQVYQPVRIGFLISPVLMRKYAVEIINTTDFNTLKFKATEKAFEEYKKQPYHVLVEVREGDEVMTEIPPRPVIYNFPAELLRAGLIEAPPPALQAQVKLVPLPSVPVAPSAGGGAVISP